MDFKDSRGTKFSRNLNHGRHLKNKYRITFTNTNHVHMRKKVEET